ncbi:MAG: alginate export family protein [Candidatus Saelkia tenebricola]|nr:alginate export family protein [Candidatus Saelkia tenebricola]
MGKKLLFVVTSAVLLGVVFSISAQAKTEFDWGANLRLRNEFWENWTDVNNERIDNRNFFRIKSSLWGKWNFAEDVSLFAKLTNENKPYAYYGRTTGKGEHYDINELVFDNLYLDVKDVFGLPVDLRIGRQDFLGIYGEGLVIMDGTPQDGSRTFYFNALKASWQIDDKNMLDIIYTNNPRDDIFLPVLNEDNAPQALNTTDEEAYILYWKNKAVQNLSLENYYIYKREDDDGGKGYQAEKGIINTLGTYAKYNFAPYTLRTQIAYQFGEYGEQDRTGLGGFVFLDRSFEDFSWKPKATVGVAYLSGDDKGTSKNEGWDSVFSRWPWMSEFYVLNTVAETGVLGYWTNVQVYRTQLDLKPTDKLSVSLWYNYLRANEYSSASSTYSLSGTGKKKGHLPQFKIGYKINKNISTYFLAEYFIPGDFYVDSADDGMFLRTEISFKF